MEAIVIIQIYDIISLSNSMSLKDIVDTLYDMHSHIDSNTVFTYQDTIIYTCSTVSEAIKSANKIIKMSPIPLKACIAYDHTYETADGQIWSKDLFLALDLVRDTDARSISFTSRALPSSNAICSTR